jgi:hypothetical protein
LLDDTLRSALINADTVPLFDNCFRDLIGELVAMIGTSRGPSLRAVAQKAAFHEDGWIRGFAQDAKVCRMHAPVHGVWQREQFVLDSSREVVRHRRMVIRFEAMNSAPARIIEMNADEDGIFLRVFDGHASIEWDENVARSSHDRFQLRLAQLFLHTSCHIERDDFFRRAGAP